MNLIFLLAPALAVITVDSDRNATITDQVVILESTAVLDVPRAAPTTRRSRTAPAVTRVHRRFDHPPLVALVPPAPTTGLRRRRRTTSRRPPRRSWLRRQRP